MSLSIQSDSLLVNEGDSCLQWMETKANQQLHKLKNDGHEKEELMKRLLYSVENDVRACSELRWSRFAFPSEPNTPLRNNYNNEKTKKNVTISEKKTKVGDDGSISLTLVDKQKKSETSKEEKPIVVKDPSRNVLRDLVLKDKYLVDRESFRPQDGESDRPWWGGYVSFPSPKDDHARFLLFPQQDHSLFYDGENCSEQEAKRKQRTVLQPVSQYWRGSIRHDIEKSNPSSVKENSTFPTLQKWWDCWKFNLFGAFRHPVGPYDTVETEMAIHQNKVERQYSADRNKVQRCTLVSDGVSLKGLRQGNPRYADSAELRLITVDSSKAEEAPPKIYSLLWKNHYHSTRQVFAAPSWWSAEEVGKEKEKDTTTKGHYTAEWQGGPGVEYSKEDAKLSIFGSLKYLAKMEIPLPKRFSLTLNSQSSVVLPLQRMVLQQIGVEEAPPAEESMIGEHRYFWATQGPTWDSNLLKGFSNDYQSLHHAKRWYSILSVEVGRDRKKMKQEPTSAVSSWGAKGFMNVCFADSLRQYPRASVGVSLVSAAPRFAVDSFNKIMPSTFSCDFSWFVAFDKKKLESGFQPGKPEEEQFMRISPVETFRNMKCGVTWNFD